MSRVSVCGSLYGRLRYVGLTRRRCGVVARHDDGLLRRAGGIAHDPGDDQGIPAEQEGEEVVSRQQRPGVSFVGDGVEHREPGHDGEDEGEESDGFPLELLRRPRGGEDDDELDEAEGDVEEGGGVFVEAEAVEDERA